MKSKIKIAGLVLLSVVVLDQMTKKWIMDWLPLGSAHRVIPGVFNIVHTRNRGAAFGFMADMPDGVRIPFFFVASFISLTLITIYFLRLEDRRPAISVCLGLILGGALGNIWDRIQLGEVVDFLSFHWYDRTARWEIAGRTLRIPLEWPAFNVADMAISAAVVWLMFLLARKKEEVSS